MIKQQMNHNPQTGTSCRRRCLSSLPPFLLLSLSKSQAFVLDTQRSMSMFDRQRIRNESFNLFSIPDDTKDDGDTSSSLFPQSSSSSEDDTPFNPFDYKARGSTSMGYSGTQISIRKTTMQRLTSELLNCGTADTPENQQRRQDVLAEYQDFLLEPLEDDDAVLDPDSIYTPGMTRAQRYEAYKASMDERVGSARNPQARIVLSAMRDFVLSFE